jgi:hypothetical protein
MSVLETSTSPEPASIATGANMNGNAANLRPITSHPPRRDLSSPRGIPAAKTPFCDGHHIASAMAKLPWACSSIPRNAVHSMEREISNAQIRVVRRYRFDPGWLWRMDCLEPSGARCHSDEQPD